MKVPLYWSKERDRLLAMLDVPTNGNESRWLQAMDCDFLIGSTLYRLNIFLAESLEYISIFFSRSNHKLFGTFILYFKLK